MKFLKTFVASDFGMLMLAAVAASLFIRIWIENAPDLARKAGLPA